MAALLCFGAAEAKTAQDLSAQLVRLHVIAASDSDQDQAEKIKVRDAMLRQLENLRAEDGHAARAWIEAQLPALAAAAQAALPEPKPVELRLCREHYPTRNYATFALPAGEYCSLQVRIGQAEGRNWWCVVYPALCRSAEGICWEEAAETAGFSDGQLRLIRVEPGRVHYRLKIAEWLDALRRRIS